MKYLHTDFHTSCTSLHSHQRYTRLPPNSRHPASSPAFTVFCVLDDRYSVWVKIYFLNSILKRNLGYHLVQLFSKCFVSDNLGCRHLYCSLFLVGKIFFINYSAKNPAKRNVPSESSKSPRTTPSPPVHSRFSEVTKFEFGSHSAHSVSSVFK